MLLSTNRESAAYVSLEMPSALASCTLPLEVKSLFNHVLNLLWDFIITGSKFKVHILSRFLVIAIPNYVISDLTGILKIVGAVQSLIDINSHLPLFRLIPEALENIFI